MAVARQIQRITEVRCFYCLKPCLIQCGHCCAILLFFGQKHQCPVVDEGFCDDDDFDVQVCGDCDNNLD